MNAPLVDAAARAIAERVLQAEMSAAEVDAAAVLLADFLLCVHEDRQLLDGSTNPTDLGPQLAIASHRADRDDVLWTLGVHPGSVVWSTVLSLIASSGTSGPQVLDAAGRGYEAMGLMARWLGPAHASLWHLSSTAAFAASAAAAAALDGEHDIELVSEAIALAMTVAGGVGQSVLERSTATQFHRAAAVSVGTLAWRSVRAGVRAPRGVLSGDRGIAPLMSAGVPAAAMMRDASSGMSATGVRLFPTNGFAQAVAQAVAELSAASTTAPRSVVVTVARPTLELALSGHHGWWDVWRVLPAAWFHGTAWEVDRAVPPDAEVPTFQMQAHDGAINRATARAEGPGGVQIEVERCRGSSAVEVTGADLEAKWSALPAERLRSTLDCARRLLSADDPLGVLRSWAVSP